MGKSTSFKLNRSIPELGVGPKTKRLPGAKSFRIWRQRRGRNKLFIAPPIFGGLSWSREGTGCWERAKREPADLRIFNCSTQHFLRGHFVTAVFPTWLNGSESGPKRVLASIEPETF